MLGNKEVPVDAFYGIATQRAVENYDITGVRLNHYPEFIAALAMTKKACARANHQLGLLPRDVFGPIDAACDEIMAGQHDDQFIVDMIQGGAGTSTNMNINEVVANVALHNMGKQKGDYSVINPNDHVNLCQSTNDSYPSAAKLAVVLKHRPLMKELKALAKAFRAKGAEFDGVIKMGRTQLQDAVPMTLGQEFNAFAATFEHDLEILERAVAYFYTLNIGGTAIGTGICADERFASCAIKHMSEVSGLPLKSPEDFIEATASVDSFLHLSGVLRRVSVKLSKTCNDLRLLASGPRCGFGEINLPPMAPGSSIMPGKINPVIPEVVNQVCFQVIGHDVAITMASEAGQLQLNVFEPIIIYNLLQSMDMLTRGMYTLRTKCVNDVTANEARCKELAHGSIGIVTALLPHIGYKKSTAAAAEALQTGAPVADVVVDLGFATREEVDRLLAPELMTTNRKLGRVCIDTASAEEHEVAIQYESTRHLVDAKWSHDSTWK
jgi:aspartate ammonia-lyase